MTRLWRRQIDTEMGKAFVVSPDEEIMDLDLGGHDREVVAILLGYLKPPRAYSKIMGALENHDLLPVAFDLRRAKDSGVGDKELSLKHRVEKVKNSRPKMLAEIMERMDIGSKSIVGHSYGGIVATKAAEINDSNINSLTVVNSPGVGRVNYSARNFLKSAKEGRPDAEEDGGPGRYIAMAGTALFAVAAYRRWKTEQLVMNDDIIESLDKLRLKDIAVTILQARSDRVVDSEDAVRKMAKYPSLRHYVTQGAHSNINSEEVLDRILETINWRKSKSNAE